MLEICDLFGTKDTNYYNRDLKPKLWDEIGEQLNVVSTEITTLIKYVPTCLYTYNIFNTGTFYIRMVTAVTNIYLSYTLHVKNVPSYGAKVKTQRI